MIVGHRAVVAAIAMTACQHDANLGTTAAVGTDPVDAAPVNSWRVHGTWTGEHPRAIAGTTFLDVWIVGKRGAIWRWGETSFLAATSLDPAIGFDAVWVGSPARAYAVGARDDGAPQLLAWDGATWTPEPTPASGALTGVSGSASVGLAATFLRRSTAGTWQLQSGPDLVTAPEDVWSSGPGGDIWIAGTTGLRRFRDTDGALVADYPGDAVFGVWGRAADDVWAVGAGAIQHWDGTMWTATPTPNHLPLRAVWAASADRAWAVGDAGTLLRWDGAAWSVDPPVVSWDLNGVWGVNETNVFAVGSSPSIGGVLRYGEGVIGL